MTLYWHRAKKCIFETAQWSCVASGSAGYSGSLQRVPAVCCNRTAVSWCSSCCVCHTGCWPRTCPSRPAPVPTRAASFQNLNLIAQISVSNFLHTNSETAILITTRMIHFVFVNTRRFVWCKFILASFFFWFSALCSRWVFRRFGGK